MRKFTQTSAFKVLVIGIIILTLLIPLGLMTALISERQHRKAEVIKDVSSGWGQKQIITGPFITIPYNTYVKDKEGKLRTITHLKHLLPDTLNINGDMTSKIRVRSIYEVVLYNSNLVISGSFPQSLRTIFKSEGLTDKDILWDQAVLSIGISDLKGILAIKATFDNQVTVVHPGLKSTNVVSTGVKILNINLQQVSNYQFEFRLNINGSNELHFVPVGKTNNININSDWKTPSFNGTFLPAKYNLKNTGFNADWKISHLNRNYPQSWNDSQKFNVGESSFGVKLYVSADIYKQSYRSIKYALLFITFTFAVFFCAEMLQSTRIHPIQYLFVGFGNTVFYTLLLSLSEHITFGLAYLTASLAITAMIGAYTRGIFNSNRLASIVVAILALQYLYIYTLLQLEDYALLAGSIGLFTGIAIIMYLTRKIDWYKTVEQP